MEATNSLNPEVMEALKNSSGSAGASGASGVGGDSAAELSESFMTLLVTQLKNQDPMNPMENAEMTSQLAQINTVNGINSLNDTLDGINSQIEAGQSLQAAELIGSGVLVPGEKVLVGEEGAATPFGVELEEPASQVEARILGAGGEELAVMELGNMDAGARTFNWDGELPSGEMVSPGSYRVEVNAVDGEGESLEATTLNYGMVNGVSAEQQGGVRLDLGGVSEPVLLDDIRKIL